MEFYILGATIVFIGMFGPRAARALMEAKAQKREHQLLLAQEVTRQKELDIKLLTAEEKKLDREIGLLEE
jgi:hypothetical protein